MVYFMHRGIVIALFLGILIGFSPATLYSQAEIVPDVITFSKARVLAVSNEQIVDIVGTDTEASSQTIRAEILNGVNRGEVITFDNDYIQLDEGAVFYLRHTTNAVEGSDYYSVADPYRLNILLGLGIVFLLLVFFFGGIQGIRGLASLAGSLVLIFWLLIPGILQGYSPILVSIGVSSLIIIIGSYITHGVTKTTTAAVLGMIGTVVLTGIAAYAIVYAANLSGYSSEESVYLNFNTGGSINMIGLLFGGIMIGLLGVLYDSAIGQAVAVEELFRAGAHMTKAQVYARAIRIGREHIGALVNTLAIAYVGVALPLLLLIATGSDGNLAFMLNSEVFATEIIRILIGSIGLVLAVPITTLIATQLLSGLPKGSGERHGHAHTH